MFQLKNNRYVTNNVDDEVPIETQSLFMVPDRRPST